MPRRRFREEYDYLTKELGIKDKEEIESMLAEKFLVSPRAVEKRILEVL